MVRIFLITVVLFALPTGGYVLWRVFLSRRAREGVQDSFDWETMPWHWLLIAGGVLVLVGIVGLSGFDEGGAGDIYERPHMIDGEIVPGRLRPRGGGGAP